VDRAATSREFPQNSENFFTCVQCGLGNRAGESRDELRGSFLPLKSNAGGSRARSRQLLVMRNKVYNVNALTGAG
jgi:hypothetical protein